MTAYRSIFRKDLFAEQTHIVTGGGSGIGRCIAHELASLGAQVVLVGRSQEKLDTVQTEIAAAGGQALTQSCDIREEDAVAEAVKAIRAEAGQIHGLVNNAGGQFPSPLALIKQKGWETVIRTNLTGGFLFARECFTQGMNREGGAVVNIIADMWGGMPGMGHSGAAREGMLNLTKTQAVEWAVAGVRSNAVAPGWIASSGMDTYEGAVKAMLPKLAAAVPLKRMGNEAEVSAAVCFLLSAGAAFITGSCLCVDGGAPLGSRIWPLPEHKKSEPFDGFPLAVLPDVLQAKD